MKPIFQVPNAQHNPQTHLGGTGNANILSTTLSLEEQTPMLESLYIT
jgi:hypothetical protein